MTLSYLLLGSNLGNSRELIQKALFNIESEIGFIVKKSSLYQTAAWGNTHQADFLNQVILVETELNPAELLKSVQEIERRLGRIRFEKWGSRKIDIDILFYGNIVLHTPDLIIPHPFLHQRKFTLMPLAEIAPQLIHPEKKQNVIELLKNLTDDLMVKKLS